MRGFRRLHRALELSSGLLEWSPPYVARRRYFSEYIEEVAQELEREPPDVVHIQVASQFIPVVRRAAPRARIVLHVHDDLLTRVHRGPVMQRLAHADAVVTCSDYIAQRWRDRFPEYAARIWPIGNGADLERFTPADSLFPPPAPQVLFVGRVSPEKGPHLLASAFNLVLRAVPEATLTLVGPAGLLPFGYISSLKDDPHVASLHEFYGHGFLDRVLLQVLGARTSYLNAVLARLSPEARTRTRILGSVSQERLPDLYRSASVLVAPSLIEEPFGLPLVEAMACGVPVVASRAGGMAGIVADGETGRLVPRSDLAALAEAISKILLDRELARSMGMAASRVAQERFSWQHVVTVLESVYERRVTPAAPTRRAPHAARSLQRAS
jgi:glycosyltransferase involved in cell wall biosynthesis